MSNPNSNYPTAQANRQLNGGEFVADAVNCVMDLGLKPKPETTAELKQRIHDYFAFCADKKMKPGIESLALSLGVSRVSFWKWCSDDCGKEPEWIDACRLARQSVLAFIENAAQSGHLSPPISIFLMKNLGNYKDTVSFEELNPTRNVEEEDTKKVIYPVLRDLQE